MRETKFFSSKAFLLHISSSFIIMLPNIAFTFITLISAILAVVISLTLFIILILRLKRRKDVPILLAANTYAAMVIFSLVILSENTFVLRIDLYDSASLNSKYWMGCSFLGFFTYERYGCCYMTFVLQALHRLVRVVYTKYKFLQVSKTIPLRNV